MYENAPLESYRQLESRDTEDWALIGPNLAKKIGLRYTQATKIVKKKLSKTYIFRSQLICG